MNGKTDGKARAVQARLPWRRMLPLANKMRLEQFQALDTIEAPELVMLRTKYHRRLSTVGIAPSGLEDCSCQYDIILVSTAALESQRDEPTTPTVVGGVETGSLRERQGAFHYSSAVW